VKGGGRQKISRRWKVKGTFTGAKHGYERSILSKYHFVIKVAFNEGDLERRKCFRSL
jgi:hypothetical protein